LPLAGPVREGFVRTPDELIGQVIRALCGGSNEDPPSLASPPASRGGRVPRGRERRQEALEALVLALHLHFPSVHARLVAAAPPGLVVTSVKVVYEL
jgi:hypothetical protein